MTLIEAIKRLRLELESGNKSLLDVLNSARKAEVDLEALKKEKEVVEKSAKDQVSKLEVQVEKLKVQVGILEARDDQLKDKLVQPQTEVEDGKR